MRKRLMTGLFVASTAFSGEVPVSRSECLATRYESRDCKKIEWAINQQIKDICADAAMRPTDVNELTKRLKPLREDKEGLRKEYVEQKELIIGHCLNAQTYRERKSKAGN